MFQRECDVEREASKEEVSNYPHDRFVPRRTKVPDMNNSFVVCMNNNMPIP